ncbi:hypothetical protein [Streptomyces chiangmaiensis]|uniref:Uncharacterized protein n=1 Tax=Streptomyces chiangmaiensis TaxID=766497 RepID=A0ABU7FJ09_9ACTN|nr:hypothetical protein [Streptomyces chiangmaiensis]MED7823915.1 hypothetical protein [Streptomyces chiangmaiensis]
MRVDLLGTAAGGGFDNTNPLLDPASAARRRVIEARAEVLADGAEFTV